MKLKDFIPPWEECEKNNLRVTVKIIFTDPKGRILILSSGTRKMYGKKRLNFPGGGVKQKCLVSCLQREIAEELCGYRVSKKALQQAKVLHIAIVPTSRKQWDGKYLVLVQLSVSSIRKLRTDGFELGKRVIASGVKDARIKIKQFSKTENTLHRAYELGIKKIKP